MSDRNTQHWYILCYTGSHANALEKLNSIENLRSYAPIFFIDRQNTSKHDVWSHRSYCFVYETQDKIYQLKKDVLARFIFMPSTDRTNYSHPYVSDYDIEQLRKVEQLNGGVIPLILSTEDVVDGDTVEILSGKFKGLTATAVTKSRSRYRQTYLYIKNFFTIPLERLINEDLRIICFSRGSKHTENFRLAEEDANLLNQAVKEQYGILALPSREKARCNESLSALIGKCKSIKSPTPDTRLRLSIIMAVAYMALGDNELSGHHLTLADTLAKKKISKSTCLFYSTLRYLCTSFPEHYSGYAVQKKEYTRSVQQTVQQFIETADELWKFQNSRKNRSASSGLYEGDADAEQWFCISAPKKKTESIKLFRDRDVTLYAPVVSDNRSGKDQKNVLKDLFFVRMTYDALLQFRNEHHGLFSILCHSAGPQKRYYTYSDETIETFDYVNSLDIPNKEILRYTARDESLVCKSQRKSITLGDRELEGYHMSQHSGRKTREKVIFLLKGVAALAVTLK